MWTEDLDRDAAAVVAGCDVAGSVDVDIVMCRCRCRCCGVGGVDECRCCCAATAVIVAVTVAPAAVGGDGYRDGAGGVDVGNRCNIVLLFASNC
jgi:hypothetical protein